jgi:hypothetical protein
MSDNIVYEITQMVSDRSAVKKDMQSAMQLVSNLFEEKYVSKINNCIKTEHQEVMHSPSKEVELLQVFKKFIPTNKEEKMEEIIDMLIMFNTFKSIKTQVNSCKNGEPYFKVDKAVQNLKDPSEHVDGIYDIDTSCAAKKNRFSKMNELMLGLALFGNSK